MSADADRLQVELSEPCPECDHRPAVTLALVKQIREREAERAALAARVLELEADEFTREMLTGCEPCPGCRGYRGIGGECLFCGAAGRVALLEAVAKAARAHAEGVGPDGYCAEHDAVEKALADLDAHDAALPRLVLVGPSQAGSDGQTTDKRGEPQT